MIATQESRILQLLADAHGAWVPLPEVMKCAAQYNARIYSLRRQGYRIENRTEVVDGERHSWFGLADRPSPATANAAPVATKTDTLFKDWTPRHVDLG